MVPVLAPNSDCRHGEITGNFTDLRIPHRRCRILERGPNHRLDVSGIQRSANALPGRRPRDRDWIIAQYLVPRNAPPFFSPFVQSVTPRTSGGLRRVNRGVSRQQHHTKRDVPPGESDPAIACLHGGLRPAGDGRLGCCRLKTVGPDITFTADGFWRTNSNQEGNYNVQVQLHPVASGPFRNQHVRASTAVV